MHKPTYYLTDAYVAMIGQLFDDVCKDCQPCAVELEISHGDIMSRTQHRAICAFIEFWDALEDLEKESEAAK
tara:strand:+ start:770 stop:985 length:216 start_codon:yes stop_codon:yes gene_type:complete